MKTYYHLTLILLLLTFKANGYILPIKVLAQQGNIFLVYEGGNRKQITFTGNDNSPVLSPNKLIVCFIRGGDYYENNEICSYNIETDKTIVLVEPKKDVKPENNLSKFRNINFSSDSRYIYFQSSLAEVTDGIHEYDLETNTVKFISAGGIHQVIQTGKYKDYLIVGKHKYYFCGISHDVICLITKDGEEVGEIGVDENSINNFLYICNKEK